MLRKFFTYVILILTCISNTLGEVLAYDESSLQSLEDLSYEASETFDSRRALLEGVDMLDASSREDALDTSLVLSQ